MRGVLLVLALVFAVSPAAAAEAPAEKASLAPEWTGDAWLNSEPLRLSELRGEVVLVEFWTFGCWNCKNVEPQLRTWHARTGFRFRFQRGPIGHAVG
jgi:thiol-disulfide isomerase/thioredoxin